MMTIEDFRASGKDIEDLGPFVSEEALDGSKGRGYADGLYIEHWVDDRNGIAPPSGPTWLLTLWNEQHMGELADLEAKLYDFAVTEGWVE